MDNQFKLLVVDRNRNVPDFLRRGYSAQGFSVQLDKDDKELVAVINAGAAPDLLILDLEMLYTLGPDVLAALQIRNPSIPIVCTLCPLINSLTILLRVPQPFWKKEAIILKI